jgi:hypothetical protein
MIMLAALTGCFPLLVVSNEVLRLVPGTRNPAVSPGG